MRRALLGALFFLASCTEKPAAQPRRDAGPPAEPALSTLPSGSRLPTAPRTAAAPSASTASSAAPTASAISPTAGDGGAGTCARTFGPAEMPFRGPAAITQEGDELAFVYNMNGAPRAHKVALPPIPARGAPVVAPAKPASFFAVTWPACAVAGAFTYCPKGSSIQAHKKGGAGDGKKIADYRAASRIAAAPVGKDHALVVFTDERTTSEGKMLQAFGVLDDGAPVRVSEDGSGATVVDVAPYRDGALVFYVDARRSMTPIHVRLARVKDDKLVLDKDAVVAVGGSPERGLSGAVASTGKDAFALVPMAEDMSTFGLAVVKIGDPPKEDTPIAWSRYPNGIDPAPVAATTSGSPARVVRARPLDATFNGPKALELGRLDDKGAFTSDAILEPGRPFLDLAIFVDQKGSVWLLHGDATVAWLERRTCEK